MRRPTWYEALPVALVVGVAAVFAVSLAAADPAPDRVDVAASGPRFATMHEMAAASDRVVLVTVVAIGQGRTIADPTSPDTGIITQLATARVDDQMIGTGPRDIVVEQEATLLDATPITVNGVAPLLIGDTGIAFLVVGTSDEFPYAALVNDQAWLAVVGGRIVTDRDDAIHRAWAGTSVGELADRLHEPA